MGHEGYLGGVYYQPTEEELKQEYQGGMKHLLVFETQADETTMIKELRKQYQKELDDMREQLDKANKKVSTIEEGLLNNPEFKEKLLTMLADDWARLQEEKKEKNNHANMN